MRKQSSMTMMIPVVLTLVALLLFLLASQQGVYAAAVDEEGAYPQTGLTMTVTITPTMVVETVMPEATATTEPTVTPTTEPTMTPTTEPTVRPTAEPTAVPVDYGNDPYEGSTGDSFAVPSPYLGKMLRAFAPVGDVDYIHYFAKAGVTEIRTLNLAGAADTYLEVYDGSGTLIGRDDDSGTGLASALQLILSQEQVILVVVSNKSLGYGAAVTYDIELIPQAEFTPTPTPTTAATTAATRTPQPAATVAPTQTPTQTPTPPPTIVVAPVSVTPRATATPRIDYVLRVELFTDEDGDMVLDSGEGIQQLVVEVNSLDLVYRTRGQTTDGIVIIPVICPPEAHDVSQLEISVPYLGQTQVVDMNSAEQTVVVQFRLEAPLLPVQLP